MGWESIGARTRKRGPLQAAPSRAFQEIGALACPEAGLCCMVGAEAFPAVTATFERVEANTGETGAAGNSGGKCQRHVRAKVADAS